jgi:phosphatidylglycerophosphatase A
MNLQPTATEAWNWRDPAQLLGTGFGLGLLPLAPGTGTSLAALPAAWLIVGVTGRGGLALAALAVFLVGVWAAGACIRQMGDDDPGRVVIDEIAGQWLTLLAVEPDLIHYAVGFVLFRAFDILKPWPVNLADRKIKGGFGVMFDDVLAAAYAGSALYLLARWTGA